MVLKRISYFLAFSSLLFSCGGKESSGVNDDVPTARAGKFIYEQHCSACHGDDGKLGAGGAMNLSDLSLSDNEIEDVIINGRKGMPSFAFAFESDEEIENVITYIRKFSEGR